MRKLIMAIVILQSTLGFAVTTRLEYSTYLFANFNYDIAESSTPNFAENFSKEVASRIQKIMPQVRVTKASQFDDVYKYRMDGAEKDKVPLIEKIITDLDNEIKTNNYKLAHESRQFADKNRTMLESKW